MEDPNVICQKYFSKPGLRPHQHPIVQAVSQGKHVIGILATGGGKTLTYQVPYMSSSGITIVVSPLIALIDDQVNGLPDALKCSTVVLIGENNSLIRLINDVMRNHGRCLIYCSPEKLSRFLSEHDLSGYVSRLVLDEAHCVSEWGNTFRDGYLDLPEAWNQLGCPPIQAMTATASPGILADFLGLFPVDFQVIRNSIYRPNLHLSVFEHQATENRDGHLLALIRNRVGPVIVYANSRSYVDRTTIWLQDMGLLAEGFHAGLDPEVRRLIQHRFLNGNSEILVATIAFGMGIDKADVRHVFHVEPPATLEDYQQQVGRAGRDGKQSWCVLFDTMNKRRNRIMTLRKQLRDLKSKPSETFATRLLNRKWDMEKFLNTTSCRHNYLLDYSGEQLSNRKCGHCDSCMSR